MAFASLNLFSRRPTNLGVVDGRLAACPASPNCVSTQVDDPAQRMPTLHYTGASEEAMRKLREILSGLPRTTIVTEDGRYLHAEVRSAVFRFVDDVEFLVDADAQAIHYRSASRAGYSDFGVNRKRMETIRRAFESP